MEFRNDKGRSKLHRLPSNKYLVQNGFWSSEFIFALQPSELTLQIPGGDPSDPPAWILGDAFLSEFYSIYDYPKSRIGLIEASETAGTISTSKVMTILLSFFIVVCAVAVLFGCLCCISKPISSLRKLFAQDEEKKEDSARDLLPTDLQASTPEDPNSRNARDYSQIDGDGLQASVPIYA